MLLSLSLEERTARRTGQGQRCRPLRVHRKDGQRRLVNTGQGLVAQSIAQFSCSARAPRSPGRKFDVSVKVSLGVALPIFSAKSLCF